MPTIEPTINVALAVLLRSTRRAWSPASVVRSENTGVLRRTGKRPDILVTEPNVSPVVIETEVVPAGTVEADAIARLGDHIGSTGRAILGSVAVRLPARLRTKSGEQLAAELAAATDLEVALYTGSSPQVYQRWPRSGWVKATIADLSILTQSATVPPEIVEEAADNLVTGVSEAAGLLEQRSAPMPLPIAEGAAPLRKSPTIVGWSRRT